MDVKFHLKSNGEPAKCYAGTRPCPIGGEHFSSEREARFYYEETRTSELFPQGIKSNEIDPKELAKLAEFTSDEEIIEQILLTGSDTALKNLGKNPNVSSDDLERAYKKAKSVMAKRMLIRNPNFPIRLLSGEDFAKKLSLTKDFSDYKKLLEDDDFGDRHALAIENDPTLRGKVYSNFYLSNPNNKLSKKFLMDSVNTPGGREKLGNIISSNRYPAEEIENLPKTMIYWGTISHLTNPDYLDGYANWIIKNGDIRNSHDSAVALEIARNPNTSADTLSKLAPTGFASKEIFENPKTPERVKIALTSINSDLARFSKIEKIRKDNNLNSILDYLGEERESVSLGRSYSASRMRVNMDKAGKLGLTPEDIVYLLQPQRYNAGFKFDPESGLFEGRIDSSD